MDTEFLGGIRRAHHGHTRLRAGRELGIRPLEKLKRFPRRAVLTAKTRVRHAFRVLQALR